MMVCEIQVRGREFLTCGGLAAENVYMIRGSGRRDGGGGLLKSGDSIGGLWGWWCLGSIDNKLSVHSLNTISGILVSLQGGERSKEIEGEKVLKSGIGANIVSITQCGNCWW